MGGAEWGLCGMLPACFKVGLTSNDLAACVNFLPPDVFLICLGLASPTFQRYGRLRMPEASVYRCYSSTESSLVSENERTCMQGRGRDRERCGGEGSGLGGGSER